MLIHNYDVLTKEYVNSEEADADPMVEGAFLIPQYSTEVAPPVVVTNEKAVFNPEESFWHIVKDFRGQIVTNPYDPNNNKLITELGVAPTDIVFEKPPELSYTVKRQRKYPPVGEQLDAIMKWIASGDIATIPKELKDIADQCMQVKAEIPKE